VLAGKAEHLPFADQTIDAAFLITALGFVDDVGRTFAEIARVLRCGGHALVAFIPKNSRFGKLYSTNAPENVFFRHATLRTPDETFGELRAAGLKIAGTVETLTGPVEQANDRIEPPIEGYAHGSFVVVRALKP